MVKRIAIICALAFAMLLMLAITLVLTTSEMTCTGATLATGRSVGTVGKFWQTFSMETSRDTATITTGNRTIIVAPMQLSVDGQVVGPIDAAAKDVVVSVRGGEVKFLVDGKPQY